MTATTALGPDRLRLLANTLAALTRNDHLTAKDRATLADAAGVLRSAAAANKRCPNCKRTLPARLFGLAGGRQSWCRGCKADAAAHRRSRTPPTTRLPYGAPICHCDPAQVGGPFGSCRACGSPIAQLMTGRALDLVADRLPDLLHQRLDWPERTEAAS